MTRWIVGLYVDGMIYVPVEAETSTEAKTIAAGYVPGDDYVDVAVVRPAEDKKP